MQDNNIPTRSELESREATNRILKYLFLGLAGGGSVAAGLSTLNNFKTLSHDAARDEKSRAGDKELEVIKTSSISSHTLKWLALLGALPVGYMAVDQLHDIEKKDRAKDEEDLAKKEYYGKLDKLHNPTSKTANALESGVGTLIALLATSALGTGYITNKFLAAEYPNPERKKIKDLIRNENKPIRIKYVDKEVKEVKEDEEDEGGVKNASWGSESSREPYRIEALLNVLLGNEKIANDSGFSDLIKAAASGGIDALRTELSLNGLDAMFEKAAQLPHTKTSTHRIQLAKTFLSTDPQFSASLKPLIAAEILEASPTYVKAASTLPKKVGEAYESLVLNSVVKSRREAFKDLTSTVDQPLEIEVGDDLLESAKIAKLIEHTLSDNRNFKTASETSLGYKLLNSIK